MPLDVISQCNRTRITHPQSIHTLASTSELEGSQALSSMDIKSTKVLNLSHARVPLQFIAQGLKRDVAQKLLGEVRTQASNPGFGRSTVRVWTMGCCHMSPSSNADRWSFNGHFCVLRQQPDRATKPSYTSVLFSPESSRELPKQPDPVLLLQSDHLRVLSLKTQVKMLNRT